MAKSQLSEPPSVTARRFYYDTVGHGSDAALLCAWKAFGAEHLLPGSDFPVLLNFETYARTFAWIREAGLPAADLEQILERNAPAALKLSTDTPLSKRFPPSTPPPPPLPPPPAPQP